MKPPCDQCHGACCKNPWRDSIVELDDDEVVLFPEAIENEDGIMALPLVNGKCLHLDDNNRCKIYDQRPKLCREFNCVNHYKPNEKLSFFLGDNPDVLELVKKCHSLPSIAQRSYSQNHF